MNPAGEEPIPASRNKAGEAERDGRDVVAKAAGEAGGGPGVNRRARHVQQIKETLQAAHGAEA